MSNGEPIKVKISDTAGQERFKSIASNYMKKANGILLVYDITNQKSFIDINNWLEEITKEENTKPIVLIEDAYTTVLERPDFPFLEGIYIDVFPIDGVPANEEERRKHFKRYKFWRHLLFLRGRNPFKHGYGPRSWYPWLLHKLFSLEYLQKRVKRLMTEYDYESSEYVADYDDGLRGVIKKTILGEPKAYAFATVEFMGVEHADEYLSNKYGNYMQLPPKEKQIQHHFFRLDLNQSYRDTTVEKEMSRT